MKINLQFTLLLSVLFLCSTVATAQNGNMSCWVVTQKNVAIKDLLSKKKPLKLSPNSEMKIISWGSSMTPNASGAEFLQSEYIVEYEGEKYSLDMKDLKKCKFKKPENKKDFWETFTLENGIIEAIAKNGIRYDLRGEMDEESVEYIGLLFRNNLIYQDEYLVDYIQSLLYKIHQGQLDDKRSGNVNLLIVKESIPNAYCLPNGTICVTTGLLSTIDSEDELIGILAHEVTHFVGDHHIDNLLENEKREKRAEFWAGVATVLAASAEVYMATSSDYYYYPTGELTYSTAIISQSIAQSLISRFGVEYNHEQEFEADETAYEVMEFIEMKPEAYVSAMNKISGYMYRTGNHAVFFNSHTHPAMDSRLARLDAESETESEKYYSHEYQSSISFINTYNARIEFDKKHFPECVTLVDKNINAGVATEEDYILKAMAIRVLYGDEKHNIEALNYLEKAEGLGIEPNSYILKQKGITYLRLNQNQNALSDFRDYLNSLELLFESGEEINKRWVREEISWTKRMIYKTKI